MGQRLGGEDSSFQSVRIWVKASGVRASLLCYCFSVDPALREKEKSGLYQASLRQTQS